MTKRPPWRYTEINWPRIRGHPSEEELLRAFQMETKTAVFYLQEGLIALHNLDWRRDFYPAAFQLLGNGLERLLKLAFVTGVVFETEALPTRKRIKRDLGHRLSDIRDEVYELARRNGFFFSRADIPNDIWTVIVSGSPLREALLSALQRFALEGRYYYLDGLLGGPELGEDPEDTWHRLVETVLEETVDPEADPGSREAAPALFGDFLRDMESGGQTFIRGRNAILVNESLHLLNELARILVFFTESTQEGPIRVFLHLRSYDRPPKLWYEWRKPPRLSEREYQRFREKGI